MTTNPWQAIDTEQVLFIIDAAHQVEEQLLLEWLNNTKAQSGFSGTVSHCVVPIVRNPEDIPTEGLQIALQVSEETLVVPIRVVWKTMLDDVNSGPKWRDLVRGNPRRPGLRRAQCILDADPSRAFCIMGNPATVQNLTERYDARRSISPVNVNLADYVAEQASLALEVAERRLRGSRYKVPRQVSKQVRASDRYKAGIQQIAKTTGESEQELRHKALTYFKELVALPHNFWQDVAGSFNRWVISLGYEDKLVVDLEKLESYRSIVREHPTALLWTHKTHMDGITIQSVLFENDFPPPHIMGGINMAFAGVGFLARRSGAIFIRRSFQDNPLYKLVLRNYLAYLLEKRFPLTWSFEGTRSRVGKLMPPRYGMLKYVMDAIEDSDADDLHIIPVAINYDMNNDVKDYAAEQAGGIKRPESLSWFISYLRRMRQPLGRIYIDFGNPVVVNKEAYKADPLALQRTAFQVGVEANRVTPITLTSLMSMSLLGAAPRAQTIDELSENMDALRDWSRTRDIQFTSDFDDVNQQRMLDLIDNMVNSGLINRYDEGPETVYAVADDQQVMASYYRNTIVHHFVSKAIAEMSLLEALSEPGDKLAAFWREANYLKDVFKFEFFYAPTEQFQAGIRAELAHFDADWESHIQQRDFVANLLRSMKPLVAHCCLKPYIESYRIVADVFGRLGEGETMDEKALVSAAFKYGRQAYLQRRISSKASIGEILFKNGYKLLDSYGLVAAGGSDLVEKRKKISKEFRVRAHRIERIRALAMPNDLD
ncbi:glycerol-3-phosphate 1-O-acyltransferase [Arenicella xantha]|uniref:Glycerol-3-phosphate acyltransferase n=1 Tax=Arenicella xantha TaxID=644221 RepID=A0A395JI35_9GAMM|nr:glycerol-3-phosphate 1-O-acyltransferase [Arenicella xantha]RBP49685.1 glycerol-3-phosphate acyltransferase [Arenicella xantha]